MAMRQQRVAVIGAGATGLVAARELRQEGHDVTVLEQAPAPGGVWVYDPAVESDFLGQQDTRARVHSSMYASLRTNLPREIMGYGDLPFVPAAMNAVAAGARSSLVSPGSENTASTAASPVPCNSIDNRRYPQHEEVLRYINAYAVYHGLLALVEFSTHVLSVAQEHAGTASTAPQPVNGHSTLPSGRRKWRVRTRSGLSGTEQERSFDAVVVANGHYSEPNLPDVPGMSTCPASQLHSHNYRSPEQFAGKVVMVVGAANSGEDISRELAEVASKVLVSARSWPPGTPMDEPYGNRGNMYRRPMVTALTPHSTAVFPQPWPAERVDAVVYATGYRYCFPFLNVEQRPAGDGCSPSAHAAPPTGQAVVAVGDGGRYVAPLYYHVFPPGHAPDLSFVGLPWKVVPFPQAQLQARLIARALSGRAQLPSEEVMQAHVHGYYQSLATAGVPTRYAHMQNMAQFAYNDELVALCGPDASPLPAWRERMYIASGKAKRGQPATYRDAVWDDAQLEEDIAADITAQLGQLAKHAAPVAV